MNCFSLDPLLVERRRWEDLLSPSLMLLDDTPESTRALLTTDGEPRLKQRWNIFQQIVYAMFSLVTTKLTYWDECCSLLRIILTKTLRPHGWQHNWLQIFSLDSCQCSPQTGNRTRGDLHPQSRRRRGRGADIRWIIDQILMNSLSSGCLHHPLLSKEWGGVVQEWSEAGPKESCDQRARQQTHSAHSEDW